jgi:nucleoside-diphosphate-sugar epimerase
MLVAGATGVAGLAAVRHFASLPGWDVIGCSRRPHGVAGARHIPLDLTDPDACRTALADLEVTHAVYAALYEQADLVAGWRDRAQMETNRRMFANFIDPLSDHASLEHVSLLQGAKAYGLHVARVPVPAREGGTRHDHENFYFLQEDHLRDRSERRAWSWTVLRPQVIFGESIGSPMNLVPAIGAYAAICRETSRPFSFPGGAPSMLEAVDADLLARCFEWSAKSPDAWGEIFNVTNGDVFVWEYVWPVIADALGVDVGRPSPARLASKLGEWEAPWASIVYKHALRSPRSLAAFVGQSFTYADVLFGYGRAVTPLPSLLSTVKIRRAGFHDCVDTEDMFRRWFARFQDRKLLPPR